MVPELTLPVSGMRSGGSKACVKEMYSVPAMPAESVMFVIFIATRRGEFEMIGETKMGFIHALDKNRRSHSLSKSTLASKNE